LAVILVAGCVDYKQAPTADAGANAAAADTAGQDAAILEEIKKLEEELAAEDAKAGDDTAAKDDIKADEKKDAITGAATADNTDSVEDKDVVEKTVEAPKNDQSSDMKVITVKENQVVKLKTKVEDPDNDPVTYKYSKPLSEDGMWTTKYGDAGEYIVTLTATDGRLTTEQKIKIVVERVNVPPVIELTKDINVNEGQSVQFEPKVSDPNNDAVTVEVSEPLKSGSFATDHTSSGEYTIKVTASDGELTSEQVFTLTVKDVNMKPVIEGVEDLVVSEGDKVTISPKVSDLDAEDALSVSISDPVGSDGVWQTTYTDNGEYSVLVSVDDGKETVTKKIKLTVKDVNKAPQIIDVDLS